jgi:hypothetical protein
LDNLRTFRYWKVDHLKIGLFWAATKWWFIPFIVLSSYGLYLFRSKARCTYGLLELLVGLGAIITSVRTPSEPDLSHFIAVLGGVYIVVRGLDNYDQGMKELHGRIGQEDFYDAIVESWFRFKLDGAGYEKLRKSVIASQSALAEIGDGNANLDTTSDRRNDVVWTLLSNSFSEVR